ncbi:729_t:CDS:1, partial [Gigaspora margarita]
KFIHAALKDIKHSLQQLKHTKTTNKQPVLLPHLLSAFNKPPIGIWESLVSSNFKKKELKLTLNTSQKKISNCTTTVAICSFLPDGNPISSYSEHWPTKITTLITLLIFALSTTENQAKIQITTNSPYFQTLISQTTDTHFLHNQRIDQME